MIFKDAKQNKQLAISPAIMNGDFSFELDEGMNIVLCSNNESHILGCFKCKKKECIYYNPSNEDFEIPFDKNPNVCPVDAIKTDINTGYPTIDHNKCIQCGLCIKRCPVNALYFDESFSIKVKYNNSDIVCADHNSVLKKQFDVIQQINMKNYIIEKSKLHDYIENVYKNIYKKVNPSAPEFCNLLVRNALRELGYNTQMTRVGDVYTRMDCSYLDELLATIVPIEVEFGNDCLEAVRNILDDVAMLEYKYGEKASRATSAIVFLQLPNKRQGYWQNIIDIDKVLEHKINTFSLGVLLGFFAFEDEFEIKNKQFFIFDGKDEIDVKYIFKSRYAIFRPKK